MATITKPELVQINKRLAAENDALRAQVSQLSEDVKRQAAKVFGLSSRAQEKAIASASTRTEAMAAARALAMSSGRCIKVQ